MRASIIRAALAAAAFGVVLPSSAFAETFSIGDIVVETPWTRATPGGARVAGGYLRIVNNGAEPDRLIGGTSEIAERFEVHSMEMRDGVARMAPVEGGLEIPAGETVELAPGGYHIMFMGLERPLTEGETVSGTLVFERAGMLEVRYPVAAMGVRAAPEGGGHSHHRGETHGTTGDRKH
jgi:periplasmic copper chaperone A